MAGGLRGFGYLLEHPHWCGAAGVTSYMGLEEANVAIGEQGRGSSWLEGFVACDATEAGLHGCVWLGVLQAPAPLKSDSLAFICATPLVSAQRQKRDEPYKI